MKFDRRLLTHFEWVLPLLSLAVSALGVTTVYSATHAPGAAGWSPLAVRQLAWLAASVAVMLAVLAFDYRRLAAVTAPVGVLAPLLWRHLKTYQQRRILTFLNPDLDPLGAGYHVIQSKIAVGSGLVWGKGFLRGTQNHLNFLPEQHTDFIFSVFAEEWGFVGAIVLMALYLGLVMRGLVIASRARDRFGVLLALGLMAIVFWQVVINVGMTTG